MLLLLLLLPLLLVLTSCSDSVTHSDTGDEGKFVVQDFDMKSNKYAINEHADYTPPMKTSFKSFQNRHLARLAVLLVSGNVLAVEVEDQEAQNHQYCHQCRWQQCNHLLK